MHKTQDLTKQYSHCCKAQAGEANSARSSLVCQDLQPCRGETGVRQCARVGDIRSRLTLMKQSRCCLFGRRTHTCRLCIVLMSTEWLECCCRSPFILPSPEHILDTPWMPPPEYSHAGRLMMWKLASSAILLFQKYMSILIETEVKK